MAYPNDSMAAVIAMEQCRLGEPEPREDYIDNELMEDDSTYYFIFGEARR